MFQIFQMFQIAACIFEIQPQETATVIQNRHIRANRRVVETSQDGMVAGVGLIAGSVCLDFALADMQIINFNENRTLSAETEQINGRAFASGVYSSGIVQLFRVLAISNDAKRSARLFEVEWCKIPPKTLDNIGDAVQGRADLKKYFHERTWQPSNVVVAEG